MSQSARERPHATTDVSAAEPRTQRLADPGAGHDPIAPAPILGDAPATSATYGGELGAWELDEGLMNAMGLRDELGDATGGEAITWNDYRAPRTRNRSTRTSTPGSTPDGDADTDPSTGDRGAPRQVPARSGTPGKHTGAGRSVDGSDVGPISDDASTGQGDGSSASADAAAGPLAGSSASSLDMPVSGEDDLEDDPTT